MTLIDPAIHRTSHTRALLAMVAATSFVLVHIIIEHSYGALQSSIARDLHMALGESAIFAAFYLAGYGLCQIPAGLLLDRYGARHILWIAALFAAVSMLLLSWVESPLGVGATRFTAGVTTSFAFSGAALVARRRLPPHWFTPAMGILEASVGLGGAVGLALVDTLLPVIGWRETVQVIAGLTALTSLACLVCIRTRRAPLVVAEASEKPLPFREALVVVWSNAQVRRCALIYGIMMGNVFGFAGFWNIQLMEAWGASFDASVRDNVAIMIGLAVSALLVGGLTRTFRAMRIVLIVSNIGAAVMLTFDLFVPWPTTQSAIFVEMFCLGFFLGSSILTFALACAPMPLRVVATAVAVVNCAGLVGAVFVEAIPGVILQVLGSSTLNDMQIALVMVVPMALIAAWAARGLKTDYPPVAHA